MLEPTPKAPTAALVPVQERTVLFYGDNIPVAQAADGELYVPLRPLTDFLGLDASAQRRRVARNRILQRRARDVSFTAADGKRYAMLALPLELLPGWLFDIDLNRVRPELAAKLERYQEECFKVLWEAFRGDIVATPAPPSDLTGAALALEIATAVQHLAQDHLALEQRVTELGGKQETMAGYMRGWIQRTNTRLDSLELRLDAGGTLTEPQAMELQAAVKAVAQILETRGIANPYQQVWGELYRRYRVAAYRNLPAARFPEALAWLQSWYTELSSPQAGDGPAAPAGGGG